VTTSDVKLRVEGPAGFIELDRGARANAYTTALLHALAGALQRLTEDGGVRVVVLGSAVPGRFCAGADLDELAGRGAADALELVSLRVFDAVAACPKPTIAAVDGPAMGGGLELALACDLRLATPRARFALPETAHGLLPAAGGTFRLPRAVGPSLARQMILFGRELDAGAALEAGLVAEVVAPEELGGRLEWWIDAAARRDPLALRLAKQALDLAAEDGGARAATASAQALLYELRRGREDEQP
jgi:enoyl-CoA hydratase